MKNNHVTKRRHFIGALALFVIACICAVLMFSNASFANPNEAIEDQATNDNQEITNDVKNPSNDEAKYLYIAGSGIGGAIEDDTLDVNSITDGIYKIAVIKQYGGTDFSVTINNSSDESIASTYISLDKYGRFDNLIFYGPAKIGSDGKIIQEPIEITEYGETPVYTEFNFLDYQFTYPDEEGNDDFYNYLEFEPIGENYFGGTIAGIGEGHDKIDLSISHYVENTEHPDQCWQTYTIKDILDDVDPSGLLWYIFSTYMYPSYPKYIEDYHFSYKSILLGRPCFVDNNGEMSMLVSVDKSEATVNVKPSAKQGYVFDHWELNGTPLKNGYSVTVPNPQENQFTIEGVTYTYYTYELYACYRDVNDCLVTFNSQGGTEVAPQTVHKGNLATEPAAPTKDGYNFGGWFTQPGGHGLKFNFATTPITEDTTLYAYWVNGPIVPPVITGGGEGAVFEHGSASPMTFTVDGLEYLTSVKVDGGVIDSKWYMCSNSVVEISLLPEYLNKLYPGDHTLTVVTSTGEAETIFNIHDNAYNPVNPDNPGQYINGNASAQTGDSISLFVLGVIAVTLFVGTSFYFRKKQN